MISILRWRRLLVFLLVLSALSLASAAELWTTREGREKVFNALVDVFRENYWDEDYRNWDEWADSHREAALEANSRQAFDSVIRRMVNELADDHSNWVGLTRYAGEPPLPSASRPRIGVRYGYVAGTGAVIERVFPSTPAAAAGLHRGDVIVSVNGDDLRDLVGSYGVNELMARAATGGRIELTVRRQQQTLRLSVTPGTFAQSVVEARPQAEMLDATTGYLYLPTFNRPEVASDVHALIKSLQEQGARSLVLDLRGNLGGRIGELGLVLGAFIEGPWAQAYSRGDIVWQGRYQLDSTRGQSFLEGADGEPLSIDGLSDPAYFTGPLAVLVNERNSSAGEIAALVLQDFGRAVVVGEATFGNVEAIRSFNLPDGSLVLVAVANVQSISGRNYSGGVVPDVEAVETLSELARGYDAPLAEALKAIKGLPFTPNKFF